MTKKITFCAAACALSLVLLMLTNILPFNTVVLICAATLLFPIARIKCGGKFASVAVVAASLLSFMFLPDKLLWAEFSLLAVYSVLKGSIEKRGKLGSEILIKGAIYIVGLSMVLKVFAGHISIILLLMGVPVFIIYDIFLTFFIGYAIRKIPF